MNAKMKGT